MYFEIAFEKTPYIKLDYFILFANFQLDRLFIFKQTYMNKSL
jgi:hypothetical protein